MSRYSKFASILITTLASLGAATLAQAASAPQCDTVHFAGSTQQLAPNTPFVGEMSVTNLQTGVTDTAEVVTMLLGYTSADGSRALTSHEVSGAPGSRFGFVTFDDAQLFPQGDGVFTLISHMVIESGKGLYNCGELLIGADPLAPENSSTLTFDAEGLGAAEYAGFGRLCRCKPSDN